MNVSALVAASAKRVPDKPALVFRGHTITYAGLEGTVQRTAAALRGLGLERGARVGLLLGNVPEFVYSLYGAFRGGLVAVPLNVMLTPQELSYILANAGAAAVVCEMQYLPAILEIRESLPDLKHVVVVAGPPVPTGTVAFDEIIGAAPLDRDVDEATAGDLAVIQYTSGTTAHPKGAMLTHGNLVANLDQMDAVAAMRMDPDDIVLLVLPMFHIYALNVVLGTALRAGVTVVLMERFDPAEAATLIRDHGVTVLPGAPPMYVAWLDSEVPADAFESVRVAVSGAAPLTEQVMTGFRERFGVTVWDSYGLTEAGPAVTTSAQGDEAVPGSIGLPLPGLEVRIVDEDGEDVEEGDPGEIVVRGPNVFGGYWGSESASEEAFHPDGWLRTGDVAVRDEYGNLFLVDRKKDLIIVSGFNVYPQEVEDVLLRHPDVAEAAVVGVSDRRTGEAVKAVVVPKPGGDIDPEAVMEFASKYLARFKVPRQVEVARSLPHHVTGKVLRRALRGEEILGGTGQSETPEG